MGILEVAQQMINGALFDYASIELVLGAKTFSRVTSINYEHGIEQGVLRGTSPFILGSTTGQYDANGSLTMYKEEFDQFTSLLMTLPGPGAAPAGGYMQKRFLAVVTFSELSSGKLITDTLVGCRILRARDNHSQGTDALMTEVELHISKILLNGKPAIIDAASAASKVGGV